MFSKMGKCGQAFRGTKRKENVRSEVVAIGGKRDIVRIKSEVYNSLRLWISLTKMNERQQQVRKTTREF